MGVIGVKGVVGSREWGGESQGVGWWGSRDGSSVG